MSFSSQSRHHCHHHRRRPRSGFDNCLTLTAAANPYAAGRLQPHPDHFHQIPYYSAQPPPLKRRRSDDDPPGRCHPPPFSVWDGGIGSNAPSTSHVFPHQQPRRNHADVVAGAGGGTWRRQVTAAVPAPEEPGEALFSRDEIERCSPSRKDGIDSVLETQLRYSYCSYLQRLGARLQLPQTTTATAIVLCHRFFFHRSHACHDRFLISTAALFLTAKSEETPCLLNSVLRASCEVSEEMELPYYPYLLHNDWFQQYRERVIEAEQLILTTLDFELDVEHPYVSLTSVLKKLGLSETALVNVALNLINEGLRSLLWLQFKPRHIAAGAAVLAAKFLNYDLAIHPSFWHAFQTTPSVLQDIVQQLKELL